MPRTLRARFAACTGSSAATTASRSTRDDERVAVELHLALDWGANAGTVGAAVQAHVADCLARMADVRPDAVDVIVDEWHSASPA